MKMQGTPLIGDASLLCGRWLARGFVSGSKVFGAANVPQAAIQSLRDRAVSP
jgi:hypothetical protein